MEHQLSSFHRDARGRSTAGSTSYTGHHTSSTMSHHATGAGVYKGGTTGGTVPCMGGTTMTRVVGARCPAYRGHAAQQRVLPGVQVPHGAQVGQAWIRMQGRVGVQPRIGLRRCQKPELHAMMGMHRRLRDTFALHGISDD